MSALTGEFVQMKAKISIISEEATNSRSDVQSTKSNVVLLKADTTTLKGDTHILKSKIVLHGNLIAIQSDMVSVKNDVISAKSELSCISNGIEHLTHLIRGRQVGEVTTLDPDIHVKSDSDVEGAAEVTAPPPAVACTSSQQVMDQSVTESELNTS